MNTVIKSAAAFAIIAAPLIAPSTALAQNQDLSAIQRLCRSTPVSCQNTVAAYLARLRIAMANGTLSQAQLANTLGALAAIVVQTAQENPSFASQLAGTLQQVAQEAPAAQATAINAVATRLANNDVPTAQEIQQAFASAN